MDCLGNLFLHSVIPDLIEPAPYLIRGNPVFSIWIFVGVCSPVEQGE